jgi:hypothetical protein
MYSVSVHHSYGHYVANVSADSADAARTIAREDALAEGLILYRVIVLRGPYGLPGGA